MQTEFCKEGLAQLYPNLKGLASIDKAEMDQKIENLINTYVDPNILLAAPENVKKQLIDSMTLVCFSHRHNKGDKFIKETLRDIS